MIGNSNTNLLPNWNTATFACMKLKNDLLLYKSERKIIPYGTREGHSWVSIMVGMSLGTLSNVSEQNTHFKSMN